MIKCVSRGNLSVIGFLPAACQALFCSQKEIAQRQLRLAAYFRIRMCSAGNGEWRVWAAIAKDNFAQRCADTSM